MYLRNCKAE